MKEILKFLELCSLDINNIRGQGYDGASSGVSTQILQKQPKALYCHCRGHNLNLVISSACSKVPEIRNLFGFVGSVPCEHSFSSLRRLKDWSRPSMAKDRLNGFALLYIHQDKFVHKMKVLRRFDSTGHRRMKL